VLRGLGWEVLRIWSTDWWIDPDSALNRVDEQLNKLLTKYRTEV
jgi:very-short-patch-repair endonuclease